MEFETKVKVDPTKIEKVFTASQITQATRDASLKVLELPELKKGEAAVSLMVLMIGALISTELMKMLGIDGPDGGYERGEAGR
jgi:hypothetical protein